MASTLLRGFVGEPREDARSSSEWNYANELGILHQRACFTTLITHLYHSVRIHPYAGSDKVSRFVTAVLTQESL